MTPSEAATSLRKTNLTDGDIAALVGSTQSTVSKIRRGVIVPNYFVGKALVDLAKRKSK